jgi:hypothetical protein
VIVLALSAIAAAQAHADDWVVYSASDARGETGRALRGWYELNKLEPLPRDGPAALHYYDRDSVASNSPFPGGTVKVWEKMVYQGEKKTYEEAREDVEREERARLKRKLDVFDMARLFPVTVNRTVKEVTTFYEVNCDTGEFFILEVNTYDKTGFRMTREVVSDKYLWSAVQQGTIMEVLSRILCE